MASSTPVVAQDPLDALSAQYPDPSLQPPATAGTRSKSPQGSAPPPSAASGGSPQPVTPAEKPGILSSIQDGWNKIVAGASASMNKANYDEELGGRPDAAAILRAPGQLVGGILDTEVDAGKFIGDNINARLARGASLVGAKGAEEWLAQQKAKSDAKFYARSSLADVLSMRQSLGQVGDPRVNQFLTNAAATLVAPEESIPAKIAGAGIRGAVTAETKQGDTAGQHLITRGIQGGEWAALEGVLQGGAYALDAAKASKFGQMVAGAVQAKNAGKTIATATPEEAATDALNRDFATQRTATARYQQAAQAAGAKPEEEPEGAQILDQGERHSDAIATTVPTDGDAAPKAGGKAKGGQAGAEDQGEQPPHPVSQDANAALEKAGSAERVPEEGPPLTPEGKIVVAPETKAALDQAGMGRAFHTPSMAEDVGLKDPVIFKEEGADGTSRVVGVSTTGDLEGFLADAAHLAKNPDEINLGAGALQGQWKLRPLGSADDVAAFGRGLADRIPAKESVTAEETLAGAKALMKEGGFESVTDAHILGGMMSDKTENLSQGITAARLMQAKINEELAGLRTTDWSLVDHQDARFQDALKSYHNGYTFMQAFRQQKSEIARALQSMQLPLDGRIAKMTGFHPEDIVPPQPVPDFDTWKNIFGKVMDKDLQPQNISGLRPLPANPREFQDAMDLWDMAMKGGPDAVNDYWKGVSFHPDAWKYLRTSFANWYTAGLVSRPTTFMRDLIGPAALSGLRTIEKSSGAAMQAITEGLFGDASRVPELLAQAADAPKAYVQTMGDINTSLKYAWNTFKSGTSRLHGTQPYDFNAEGIPASLLHAAGYDSTPLPYTLGNAVNVLPSAIHRLHAGVNELALRLSYLGEIRAQAMLEARNQGLEGDAFSQYVKDSVMGSEDPLNGAALDSTQLDNAQRTTFTKPVGGDTEPLVRMATQMLGKLRDDIPETRYIMPIFTVPANNLGETIRRIPLLGQALRGTASELRGEAGPIAQAEAYGRFMTGTAFLYGGLMMSRSGLMTGAGPSNPKDKATWEASGFQPWSIKVGGQWVSYNKIDAVGSMLGLVAGLHDDTVYHAPDNPTQWYTAAASSLAEYFKDQSNLKGVSELLDFGSNPAEDQGRMARMTKDIAGGFVPGFIQSAAQAVDPDRRVTMNPWEAVKKMVPGASATLDPVRNLLGEAVHVPNNVLGVLPVTTAQVNPQAPDNEILTELHRLFLASGYQPGVLPPSISGAGVDQRNVKLEDGHSLYDARMRYRDIATNDDGQTLKEALTELIQSDDYKDGFDGSPRAIKLTDDDDKMNRAAAVEKLFTDFDKQARQKVANDSPLAARYLAAAAIKQREPTARAYQTKDLATNDALVKSLGVNMQDYIEKVQGQ